MIEIDKTCNGLWREKTNNGSPFLITGMGFENIVTQIFPLFLFLSK